MGPNIDKLFLELDGAPVALHTWRRLEECADIDEVLIVCRAGMEEAFRELATNTGMAKPFRFAQGGPERQDSVWNGLAALYDATEIVAIQDAARPCTPPALISATIAAARETGAAVAAHPITDTVKESMDARTVNRTLDRSKLWAVQTPQTFKLPIIRQALAEVKRLGLLVTDDTAACELIHQPVRLVSSAQPNPKVTRPEDLPFIELLLRQARRS